MEDVTRLLIPIKDIGEGWYQLKWKPIKKRTYNYWGDSNTYKAYKFIIMKGNIGASGVYFDRFDFSIHLWKYSFDFWIIWNISTYKDNFNETN